MKAYIGIDNGVTGAVGLIARAEGTGAIWRHEWSPMPVRRELSYTKAKKHINRIDTIALKKLIPKEYGWEYLAAIERPMVNPGRFAATLSAMRALEATLIVLEQLGIPYMYLDSREWQKTQLPSGLEGPELKQASRDIARRLFPQITFPKTADADALLMARHCMLKNL